MSDEKYLVNMHDFLGVVVGYNSFIELNSPHLLGIYSYICFIYQKMDVSELCDTEIMEIIKRQLMYKFNLSKRMVNKYVNEISDMKIINKALIDF